MRKIFLIFLFLLAPFLTDTVNAQYFWVTDPFVAGKLTFKNGWTLYDTTAGGLKIPTKLWISQGELFLGNSLFKDSAGYLILNKPLMFRSINNSEIAPWITNDMLKDTSINGSKIKTGTITFNEIAPTTKDSIFGSTNLGTLDIAHTTLKNRVNVILDSKGDFKPGIFDSKFIVDTLNNTVKLDTTKFLLSADSLRFITGGVDTSKFLHKYDTTKFIKTLDTAYYLTQDDTTRFLTSFTTSTLLPKSDSIKFWRKLELDTANYISKTRVRTDTSINNYFISINDIAPYATVDSVTTLIDQAVFSATEGAWTISNLDTTELITKFNYGSKFDSTALAKKLWQTYSSGVANYLDTARYYPKLDIVSQMATKWGKSELDTALLWRKSNLDTVGGTSSDVTGRKLITKTILTDTLSKYTTLQKFRDTLSINYWTKTQIKATDSLSNYYTKTQVKATDSLTNYFKKTDVRASLDSVWYKKTLDTMRYVRYAKIDSVFIKNADTLALRDFKIPITKLDSSKLGYGLKYNPTTGELDLAFNNDSLTITKTGSNSIKLKPKMYLHWVGVNDPDNDAAYPKRAPSDVNTDTRGYGVHVGGIINKLILSAQRPGGDTVVVVELDDWNSINPGYLVRFNAGDFIKMTYGYSEQESEVVATVLVNGVGKTQEIALLSDGPLGDLDNGYITDFTLELILDE